MTPRHVLLPAHCIQNKRVKQAHEATDAFIVFENDIFKKDRNVAKAHVSEYIIHPDWDPEDTHYSADIAIAIINEPKNITNEIGHVCLNTPANPIQSWAGKRAEVYGWGLNEDLEEDLANTFAYTLGQVISPLVDQAKCNSSILRNIMADTSFCAGSKDGRSGPSNGKDIPCKV